VKNAIRLKSDYADAYNTLGIIQLQQERFDEAKSSIEMALKLNPGYSLAWLNLGLVHRSLGNSNEIKACLEKAVSGNPRMAKAWVVLAQDAIDNGHFDIAGKYLEIAENVDPEGVEAWSAKVLLKKMKPSDSDWIEKAEALLGKAKTSSAVSNLRFSMGKYYDDIGDYDKAFDSYKQANDLAGASKKYNDDSVRSLFQRAVSSYESYSRFECGSKSDVPVYVVGMPRSGTSLVEQILAAHPHAYGAGELQFWANVVEKQADLIAGRFYDVEFFENLASLALQDLNQRSGGNVKKLSIRCLVTSCTWG